jgi:hypothetical protein
MPSRDESYDWLDGSLYPDRETPEQLATLEERIDFLARLCSSWDFGVLPEQKTVDEIRGRKWREAVDRCRLLTSPTYHMLREWHELRRLPYLGRQLAYIRDDPCLKRI